MVAYHGLSRAMEMRTVKMEQMSHLYVVISHLLHVFFFDSTLMALFAAHLSSQRFVFQLSII